MVKQFTTGTQLSKPRDKERRSFRMDDISSNESVNSKDKDDEDCSEFHIDTSAQPKHPRDDPLIDKNLQAPSSEPSHVVIDV